jgi:predicted Zn-dependent protease
MQPVSPCAFCRALQAAQEGRFQDALCLLDVILDDEPVHHQARLHRAKLYALTGKPQDAVDEFRTLMHMPEFQVEAHLNLAGVYLLLGMYDDAMQHLRYIRICEEHDPETPDLLRHWRN